MGRSATLLLVLTVLSGCTRKGALVGGIGGVTLLAGAGLAASSISIDGGGPPHKELRLGAGGSIAVLGLLTLVIGIQIGHDDRVPPVASHHSSP